jgi:hypothetical protein
MSESGGMSLPFLTSALNGGGQLHSPAFLPPVLIGQEAGWAPEAF